MLRQITLDGEVYSVDDFSPAGKDVVARLSFVMDHIRMLNNNVAVLNKAKNSYIEDLKFEAIEGKSGISISDLFDEV
jgi:hypothetical protein